MYRLTLDQFEATDLKNTGYFLDLQDPALFIKIGDGKEKFTARYYYYYYYYYCYLISKQLLLLLSKSLLL